MKMVTQLEGARTSLTGAFRSPALGRPPSARSRLLATDVSAIIALDLVSAGLCAFGALRPASPETPVGMNACFVVVALALAIWIWRGSSRARAVLIPVNVVIHVLGTSLAVTQAATGEGAVSAAVSYVLLTLYVASFLPRAVLRPHLVLAIVSSGAAMQLSDAVVNPLATWLPIVMAVVVSAYLFSAHVEEMRRLSLTDPLTGALNRNGMVHAIAREQADTARSGRPLVVVAIDLDGFKSVNDADGHAAGDALLVDLVDSWQSRLRPRDVVIRRGGDEFVLLLPDAEEDETVEVLRRLREGSPIEWSSGVARLGAHDDPEVALRLADTRMYECKHSTLRPAPVADALDR